jgi:hypothetical protein
MKLVGAVDAVERAVSSNRADTLGGSATPSEELLKSAVHQLVREETVALIGLRTRGVVEMLLPVTLVLGVETPAVDRMLLMRDIPCLKLRVTGRMLLVGVEDPSERLKQDTLARSSSSSSDAESDKCSARPLLRVKDLANDWMRFRILWLDVRR